MFLGVGMLAVSLWGFVPLLAGSRTRLRPPGALAEKDFLAACIKCGQCVQVCPVQAIKLTDLDDGFGIGTPYIDARRQACDFSCDAVQCVLACPTEALSHKINYPLEVSIGLARLAHPNQCLAYQGKGFKGQARGPDYGGLLRYAEVDRWNPIPVRDHPYDLELCDLCIRQCPIEIQIAQCTRGESPSNNPAACPPRHAIVLEPEQGSGDHERMIPVVKEGCVGCGVCEMICPVAPAAIVVDEGKAWEQG
jgi:ferredoxin-type protein NapG